MNSRQRRHEARALARADQRFTAQQAMRPGLPPKGSNRNNGASLAPTQVDGSGKRSDWSRPASLPYSLSVTTHQSRWSQTVSNRSV